MIKVIKRTEAEIREENARNAAVNNASKQIKGDESTRNEAINEKVRERYSLSEELALTRHALAKLLAGEAVPQEYLDFNAYVEQCKAEVAE